MNFKFNGAATGGKSEIDDENQFRSIANWFQWWRKKYPKIIALISHWIRLTNYSEAFTSRTQKVRIACALLIFSVPTQYYARACFRIILFVCCFSSSLSRVCIDRPQRVCACRTYNCISFINFIFRTHVLFTTTKKRLQQNFNNNKNNSSRKNNSNIYKFWIAENLRKEWIVLHLKWLTISPYRNIQQVISFAKKVQAAEQRTCVRHWLEYSWVQCST